MAYNAALNTVYNHYLTTYAPKTATRYDTHKKSELRSVYNSMVKLNKESPLYIIDSSKESREFAVGLKENSRQLRNTIASLGGLNEDAMFNQKAAYSSNEDIVSAAYIGEASDDSAPSSFEIEVLSLASAQSNYGAFLPSEGKVGLEPDAYSFDISINDLSYEFQYNIKSGETNRELQDRLARLITNADIGIHADVVGDEKGHSSLRLTSEATGLRDEQSHIFKISENNTSKRSGSVNYLGIDFVSREPANAEFLLNGEHRTAMSNHFTVDKTYELTLNGISPAEGITAAVGLKTDLDSLTENIDHLIGGYNSFVRSAAEYLSIHPKSGQLLNEMEHITRHYQFGLENLGITPQTNGELSLDKDAFQQTVLSDGGREQLSNIKDFTNSILRKTGQISLNPMEYVDKKIVAYKNPGHNFATPYVTSNYSGMLFNGYC